MQNVFLFTGLNLFAIRQEKLRWTREFASKHGMENLLSIDRSDISLQKILDEVSSAPFIAARRLVVINGVPKFQKEDMRRLLDAVHPSCILLFVDPSPDKRLGGLKELLAVAEVKQFSQLTGKSLQEWMQCFARECGSSINQEAVDQLLRIVGNDQEMLAQELSKIALGAGPVITAAHVSLLAVPSGDQEILPLTSLLARGELTETLEYVRILIRSGQDPFHIWNMLLWVIRSFVGIKLCVSDNEISPAKIAPAVGVSPQMAKAFLPLAQKISMRALRDFVAWSVAADRDLKTGVIRATVESAQELVALIDELVVRFCGMLEPAWSPR